jgi:hypothetical protein
VTCFVTYLTSYALVISDPHKWLSQKMKAVSVSSHPTLAVIGNLLLRRYFQFGTKCAKRTKKVYPAELRLR